MRPTEDELCGAFAETMKEDPGFASWVLQRTKFAHHATSARLLHEEQMSIRPRKHWWRHWWCHVPELQKDRETDIFMMFQLVESERRFALHLEIKRDVSRFTEGQARGYAPRGRHMLNKRAYLNHNDFTTVLVAPITFRDRLCSDCDLFDLFISHEDVARFVPIYRHTRS